MAITVNNRYLSLDEMLYNLLHDYNYRRSFFNNKFDDLNLSKENIKHIQTIDKEELIATANTIIRNIMNGNIEHSGGLKSTFPGVYEELEYIKMDITQLMFEFVASKEFEAYKEVPYAGSGICIEEAFYKFMKRNKDFNTASANKKLLLTHEFLTALLSILTVNKEPYFEINSDLLKHNGHIYYATQNYPKPIAQALLGRDFEYEETPNVIWLYAATESKFIKGPISKELLEIIELGSLKKINIQNKYSDQQISMAINLGFVKK